MGIKAIGHNTIARALNPDSRVQPTLGTIVAIAKAFKVAPCKLISANFDPQHRSDDRVPEAVTALAQQLYQNRDVLLEALGPLPVSDQEMEALGWSATARKKKKAARLPPRQFQMPLKSPDEQ